MPEVFPPVAVFRNRPATFRIRLDSSDHEGIYQFRFKPEGFPAKDTGFAQPIVNRVMRRGSADADLEVRFLNLGVRELQYHFASDADDLLPVPAGASAGSGDDGSGGDGAARPRSRRQSASAARSAQTIETESVAAGDETPQTWSTFTTVTVEEFSAAPPPDQTVALAVTPAPTSADEELWYFIRRVTERLRFAEFHEFVLPRMTGARGVDWTDTGAFDHLSRLSKQFIRIAADPVRAAGDRDDPSFSGISADTARAGVLRSYVSDQDLDLAQPFLGFDGLVTAPFDPLIPDGDDDEDLSGTRSADPEARHGNGNGNGNGNGHANGHGRRNDFDRLRFPGGRRHGFLTQFPLPNVPFVELLWAYWMDECGLAQTMNLVLARFQNRRVGGGRDVLARFNANPLLPIANLLWGFAEAEEGRLTVRRRAAEYRNMYGLPMRGKAVPPASAWVDDRSQFLSAFHNLLHATYRFYKERDDKTVDADAFPLLSSLQEVHLVLSHGAHNQFPAIALRTRREFLVMQWILAQPEMREFLGGPTMVPQEEKWMDRVDTMKDLQGWSPTSVTHFLDLAVCGEQILLTARHGRWNESTRTRDDAANWAITWRNEIQRYVHAYRAVTGVDLMSRPDPTPPSVLLARRERGPARR